MSAAGGGAFSQYRQAASSPVSMTPDCKQARLKSAADNELQIGGPGIDPPLAFGMCGERGSGGLEERKGGGVCGFGGGGLAVANVDDLSSSSLLCEVAFDCELVTRSCYLLLLAGLAQSLPPPPTPTHPKTPPPPSLPPPTHIKKNNEGKGWTEGSQLLDRLP